MITRKPYGPIVRALLLATGAAGGSAVGVGPAMAQVTTGSIRGTVTDADGNSVGGAVVTIRDTASNQSYRAVTDRAGHYAILRLPAGAYDINARLDGVMVVRKVRLLIGQNATLNLQIGGAIVVTGRRENLVEVKTSEVASNVTPAEIAILPQTDRNFLSFTQLAPGVQYNDSETNRGFQSGAATPAAVNVFIDGVNFKNTVLDQGVAGQQDSRGNAFAQLAVQEFRVITQNYKAEYEQAAAAVVTSITKTGSNALHGEGFISYTGKELSEKSVFDIEADRPEPAFKRIQYGASLGGPIIKDKLFFFAAYEGNDQDRAANVILGTTDPALAERFAQYEGAFVSPFRSDLVFGKLTWEQDAQNRVDLSLSHRKESDIQGFGGQIAYEAAENKKNTVNSYNFQWTHRGDQFVNALSAHHLSYKYNPTALNPDLPSQEYRGIITIGGKDATQDIRQQVMTLRNDLTWYGLAGHSIKAGAKLSVQDYKIGKLFFAQPRYTYFGPDYAFPLEARLGLGNPNVTASNTVIGVYIQDDWDVNARLQINMGLRADRESNMFNNDYVTPVGAAELLRRLPQTDYFQADDYISDGTNRRAKWLWQPRLGFSYDLTGDERTVIFGGYGRYFDRNVFNNTVDEKYRQQYTIGTFLFSQDGAPRSGQPTVIWDPAYATRAGLLALRETALTGLPELFAVKNDAQPPSTDQFSFGIRQRFGDWRAALTASYIRGQNGYTHLYATRFDEGYGNCCDVALANSYGYSNVLIGFDGLETRYKAAYFELEKPYDPYSGWGFRASYTLQNAEQNGNDLFSFDKVTPADYGFRRKAGVEKHAITLSGIVDLPWGLRLSSLSLFGSGQAFQTFYSDDFSVDSNVIGAATPEKNCLDIFARCEVNIKLAKEFALGVGRKLWLAIDVFNVFNNKNYTAFNSFSCCNEDPSVFRFGEPNALLTLPRRVQLSAGIQF